MNVAALNARIIFQRLVARSDSIGNHFNVWENFYRCWATVTSPSGSTSTETEEAGQTVDHSKLNFTVRYCEKTAQVTPTEYRIFFNGRAYDIERVDIMALHKRSLKFMAVLR